jgi:hypothetical protein
MSKIFDRSKFREPVDARGNQMATGKYDDLCTYVREQTKADGVVVIVVGGDKGHGFAVQCDPGNDLDVAGHTGTGRQANAPPILKKPVRNHDGEGEHQDTLQRAPPA